MRLAASKRENDYHATMAVQQLTPHARRRSCRPSVRACKISERLHVSFETERSHMTNILAKLGAESRLQALVFAARSGIVEIR